MSSYEIREFRDTDQPGLLVLLQEFAEYIQETDRNDLDLILVPEGYAQHSLEVMLNDVHEKEGKIFVLTKEEEVVGLIAGILWHVGEHDDELDCKPHLMGRVIDLYITEADRKAGQGKRLLEAMEEYFRESGCAKINIQVFAPNHNAQEFYQKQAYRARNIDLVKPLKI